MEVETQEQAPKKKKGYSSDTQMRRLIELLDADPELRSGKFSAAFTHKIAQKRWCVISDELNAIGGAHKTWAEWRKCYQDKRAKTKKKASAINRSVIHTGGGKPESELNEDETFLLSTISSTSVSGHSDSKESRVVFRDFTNSRPSSTRNVIPLLPRTTDRIDIDMTRDVMTQNENLEYIVDVNIEEIDLTEVGPKDDATQKEQPKHCGKIETETASNTDKKRKSILKKSQEAATALQKSLQEKNKIKREYYKKKIELLSRQTEAIEAVARSFSARANPYI